MISCDPADGKGSYHHPEKLEAFIVSGLWAAAGCRLQMVLESVCRAEESGAESRRGDNTPPCRHRCSAAVPSHTAPADT